MNEIGRLIELLRQAYEGEPGREDGWHGPSLRKLLVDVTAEQAAGRPVADGHSIWELVLHIAVWDEICARRLRGERVPATTGSPEDWPAVGETTEAAWQLVLQRLASAQRALIKTVHGLRESVLDEPAAGCQWTNYLMIHGTLHHDLYHAGQIGLLKRALG